MHLSLIHALGIVDCVILKRLHGNEFKITQANNHWFTDVFNTVASQTNIVIDEQSIFLSDFLVDAIDFWNMHSEGQIESGIWTERTKKSEYHFEAIAACTQGVQYLVIKNVMQQFQQQRQTLQVARELLISNVEIVERHDYLNQRLHAILVDNANENSRLPLYDVIKFADIGVIIIDQELVVQETNPTAYRIFETLPSHQHSEVFDTIVDLIHRQYPEKDAIFKAANAFSGELYWHRPPLLHKWLKIDINPVSDGKGKLTNWIITFSDMTRVKYLLQTNEELALHDSLTGLPNRQYFWQELNKLIEQSHEFYVLSIDVVNFKYVNEQFGYLEGDELLRQISERIAKLISPQDFITRIGADEFMILHRHNPNRLSKDNTTFTDEAMALANALCEAALKPLYTKDNRKCELSIKVGLAYYPFDATSSEELLTCADLAMSSIKGDFEKTIQLYSDDLRLESVRRLLLEDAMQGAIEKHQFELYIQPIFDLSSGRIIKGEALLRWHLDGEDISPTEFIPIAEKSGLINVIGRWVIAKACEFIAELNSKGLHLPVSVNFSPQQIHDTQLISFIRTNIETHSILPNLLELEVTEGVLIHNYEKVKTFLTHIKATGLNISVDDFGTGYSSLSYLKHLPIDTLKIDRSFIIDLAVNEDDQAIVSAIIAMAKNLKLDVVAEGVETEAQKSYLLTNHCTKAQGFIMSQAIPVGDFIALCVK